MAESAWIDSESEEQGRETQAFKLGECLRPFYQAAHEVPDAFGTPILARRILFRDTQSFFKLVERDGFFPSPYSPIPESGDQYTDFAAFVLEFCGLVNTFWRRQSSVSPLPSRSKTLAKKALNFLMHHDHCLEDEKNCRWGGTNKYARVKKSRELYTSTYFTSMVVIALTNAIKSEALNLPISKQEEVRKRIRKAGNWIVERFDGQALTGDELKTDRKTLYTTWGLRALSESYSLQDTLVRKRIPAIANAYLDSLGSIPQFGLEQDYVTILSAAVDVPLYYEDRSGLAGVLLTLGSLQRVPQLEALLIETPYSLIVEKVFNSVLSLRDPTTSLWYKQQLILSINSYLASAFLALDRSGKGLNNTVEISGFMIRRAIQETLSDEAIIAALQQTVYEKLLRQVESAVKERKLQEGINKLIVSDETDPLTSTPLPNSKSPKRSSSQPRRIIK